MVNKVTSDSTQRSMGNRAFMVLWLSIKRLFFQSIKSISIGGSCQLLSYVARRIQLQGGGIILIFGLARTGRCK